MRRRYFCKLTAAATLGAAMHERSSGAVLPFSSLFGNARADAVSEISEQAGTLEEAFANPPDAARPGVLWMWMGTNISKTGMTKDLEAMREAGIGVATIYTLADTLTPWACEILASPTPGIVAFTEPWWAMVRHACNEAERLGIELILHNCAGYESSGGTWITPELSMQEMIWSRTEIKGGNLFRGILKRPSTQPYHGNPFPKVYVPSTGQIETPMVAAKETYYRDIATLAVPANEQLAKSDVVDLSSKLAANGEMEWDAPDRDWIIYRFGHTTTGAMIQPAQWEAMGLECDKMSQSAVAFHVEHVIAEMKKHLGEHVGKTLTTLYFDSYEAGTPSWTPKMREEFLRRRHYDLLPWLPVFAGHAIDSQADTERFKKDFQKTIHDLYRDCYWATPGPIAHASGLKFAAEPYEGPWEISEVVKYLDVPTVEFWTTNNEYSPSSLAPVVKAAHLDNASLIAAESFTSQPEFSQWRAHPAWLKPIGDAAFCAGVNRINVHNFVQQPWDEKFQPGNAMGQWGIHLGRYQTWWQPGKAWIAYLRRCQALLQRGKYVAPKNGVIVDARVLVGTPKIQAIQRREGGTDVFFVANLSPEEGSAICRFPVTGKQPELWNPVTGKVRKLGISHVSGGVTEIVLEFAPAESYFIVFRKAMARQYPRKNPANFPRFTEIASVHGAWDVAFDPAWGGPEKVQFAKLEDWTNRSEPGIKFYSGTAVYRKVLRVPHSSGRERVYLDCGTVKHIAEVNVNGQRLGVLWTAPWRLDITDALKSGENVLEIAVSNVWANRLIGDEHERSDMEWERADFNGTFGAYLKRFPEWFINGEQRPSRNRYTFTTWNYFTKESALEPSGLIGPVRILSTDWLN